MGTGRVTVVRKLKRATYEVQRVNANGRVVARCTVHVKDHEIPEWDTWARETENLR